MKFLQKLGKALMLPVAVLPICGILMGIGYWILVMSGNYAGRRYPGCSESDWSVFGKSRSSAD